MPGSIRGSGMPEVADRVGVALGARRREEGALACRAQRTRALARQLARFAVLQDTDEHFHIPAEQPHEWERCLGKTRKMVNLRQSALPVPQEKSFYEVFGSPFAFGATE